MDPKTVLETGKATVGFLKAILDFIGNSELSASETNRLLSFYLAIQSYLEVKEDYFRFLKYLDEPIQDKSSTLWQAKKLSHIMATRHYEAYSLADGLDFQVRAHEHTLHDLIRVYKTRVSLSLGFGAKDVAVASAFKSIAATALKRKHFSNTYRIKEVKDKYFVGDIEVGDNQKYQNFVHLHEESNEFMNDFISELDVAVKRQVEANDSHNKAN